MEASTGIEPVYTDLQADRNLMKLDEILLRKLENTRGTKHEYRDLTLGPYAMPLAPSLLKRTPAVALGLFES